jgi:2-enoate reductase
MMTSVDDGFVRNLLDHAGDWFDDGDRFRLARLERRGQYYPHLFSPLQVNRLRLKNRIVMGPMANLGMADEWGRPGEKMIRYFAERARGGVGLITTGAVAVSLDADPTFTEGDRSTSFPRLKGSRAVFPGWRDLATAIHAHGAHVFVQLSPGIGRVGDPEVLMTKHRLPVSASWNPNFYMPAVPCRPLTDGELRRIVRATGQSAADAKAMGLDGVYLHGHEGYLLEQMSNPAFNRRPLGRYADWQAFGADLVREMRQRVGPDFAIMYRIDLSLALNATYGDRRPAEEVPPRAPGRRDARLHGSPRRPRRRPVRRGPRLLRELVVAAPTELDAQRRVPSRRATRAAAFRRARRALQCRADGAGRGGRQARLSRRG